jgi:hypothetical protein
VATDELPATRTVQGRQQTVLAAAFHSITHFGGHTQEIVNLTRQQLGDAYVFEAMPPAGREARLLGEGS